MALIRRDDRLSTTLLAIVIAVLGAAAFASNWATVRGLSRPGFDIQFRELAAAQTFVDQGYGPDSTYAGEHIWYNPMAAWVAATLSRVSGLSLPLVIARAGPFVNLAAPAAFFLLVAVTVDAFAALAATAAFVFLAGTRFPFYYAATYSPWFAPENFGQAFLYLLLAAAWRARRPGATVRWDIACGVLLGLTFLTHTAPAIIGGLVLIAYGVAGTPRGQRGESARRVALALGVAFVVSSPFGLEILWRYHLHVRNPFPGQSPSDLLDFNELGGLARSLITVPTVVSAVGFAALMTRRRPRGAHLLLTWLGVVVFLLVADAIVRLGAKAGVHLTPIVPAFHYFFYLIALVSVGFGLGVCAAVDGAASAVVRMRWLARAPSRQAREVAVCVVVAISVTAAARTYEARPDVTLLGRDATAMNRRYPAELFDWVRGHAAPDGVFLCADDVSVFVVAPAGRKVVATNRYFSNPYVNWQVRDADRKTMFAQLRDGRVGAFEALAREYRVRYVVLSGDRTPEWLRAAGLRASDLPEVDGARLAALPGFARVASAGRFEVFEYCRPDRSTRLRQMPDVHANSRRHG